MSELFRKTECQSRQGKAIPDHGRLGNVVEWWVFRDRDTNQPRMGILSSLGASFAHGYGDVPVEEGRRLVAGVQRELGLEIEEVKSAGG